MVLRLWEGDTRHVNLRVSQLAQAVKAGITGRSPGDWMCRAFTVRRVLPGPRAVSPHVPPPTQCDGPLPTVDQDGVARAGFPSACLPLSFPGSHLPTAELTGTNSPSYR